MVRIKNVARDKSFISIAMLRCNDHVIECRFERLQHDYDEENHSNTTTGQAGSGPP